MFKLPLLVVAVSVGLTACVSNQYSQVSDLRFQEKKPDSQVINVQRDGALCAEDTAESQNCPINFYIDSIKAGDFYINNSTNYYLKPEIYNLKVKNCTTAECQSCDVDLNVGQLADPNFILSVDEQGKPFISNGGQPLVCEEKSEPKPEPKPEVKAEKTILLDLDADTLFKFNGSSLNDLHPRGHQEILHVASQISNEFVSVRQIKLTGHTDRLGSDRYNYQLGQDRANTVRTLLVQNGVSENIVIATSAGKNQPLTDGCTTVKDRQALQACLQPDRRVTVEITGIPK